MGRCEEALRKLHTDHLDLFQVHFASPEIAHEELLRPLNDLVEQGKVRYVGNCNTASWRWHEEIMLSQKEGLAEFQSTQNHYSLLYRHAEVELIPFCRAYRRSLLAYFPLAGGWLTGTYRPGEPYPEGTRAAKVPTGIVTRIRSERVERLVPLLEQFAAERGHSIVELALAWVISRPEVALALTGFDRPEHVAANVKAVDWKLSTDDLKELDSLTSWWEGTNAAVDSADPAARPAG
jgi:aryl-alcohol dehydrogenase-like predicted oxidoreductase